MTTELGESTVPVSKLAESSITARHTKGVKFFFYANDHLPVHVHVLKGERWAKIELQNLEVKYSTLKNQELKQCLAIVKDHRSDSLESWYAWFQR